MPESSLTVLYEDNHLLALNKRAGVPTLGVAADRDSLLVRAKYYIKRRYQKPGNVDTAIELFTRALALDSSYALASAGLGRAYWQKYELSRDTAYVGQSVTMTANGKTYTSRLTVREDPLLAKVR